MPALVKYLLVEHGPHHGIKGTLGDEVVYVDRHRLPDTMGAILSLLNLPGVPVELGKHHVAGSGEGQTLGRSQKLFTDMQRSVLFVCGERACLRTVPDRLPGC